MLSYQIYTDNTFRIREDIEACLAKFNSNSHIEVWHANIS